MGVFPRLPLLRCDPRNNPPSAAVQAILACANAGDDYYTDLLCASYIDKLHRVVYTHMCHSTSSPSRTPSCT